MNEILSKKLKVKIIYEINRCPVLIRLFVTSIYPPYKEIRKYMIFLQNPHISDIF